MIIDWFWFTFIYTSGYIVNVTDTYVHVKMNIYASWFMNIVTNRIRRLNILNIQIPPRDGRWLITVLDCLNFVNSREFLNIFDSKCEWTVDDGLNVHQPYLTIVDIINSTTVITEVTNSIDAYIDVGDRVELSIVLQNHLQFIKQQQSIHL